MHKTNILRIGIYARYSSDLQNPSSVRDQMQLCRKLIEEQYSPAQAILARLFYDNAISGSTMNRPGLINLLSEIENGNINLIVAEGLDRISRSLKDIAAIHETLNYYGAEIITAHEGKITALHVGLKGTMNALFLKDMKDKVRRGQKARVEAGYASSSIPYGYRKIYGAIHETGRVANGVREIVEEEAVIIRRIYDEYAAGKLPSEIVEQLNLDNIPSPGGGLWKKSVLMGSSKKKDGILRSEKYLGKLIFNKSFVTRDPITNRKRITYNPEEKWTKVDVPHLRIISDEQWEKARRRDRPKTYKPRVKKQSLLNSHNQHALTGWVFCGECGSRKTIANASRYLCSGYRYARTCSNARGTKEERLKQIVVTCILDRIRNGSDFRNAFVERFSKDKERNEKLRKESETIKAKIKRLVMLVAEGISDHHTSEIIRQLQDELEMIDRQIQEIPDFKVPSEDIIRNTLFKEVGKYLIGNDIEKQHIIFSYILNKITLTPIKEQRSGEKINIKLREEGWPDLWRLIWKQ